MDIKILDSHLREHLLTNAKPHDLAKALSLTSASIERVEPYGKDMVYSVEITTNRPDMVAVRGIAEEAAAVLPYFGFEAKLLPLKITKTEKTSPSKFPIAIENDDKLVRRILGIIMEVEKGESPEFMKERLEAAGIRSLNNLIDITNYVMLEIGHPCHVFDFDRLDTKKLIIRASKKGEKLVTLDHKEHTLLGGDIVADNGKGEIVDLLGVMGTANSVVTDTTKRILFFFDNNDPWRIRQTSMGLAIRTDAAALNEKGVDPELAFVALERGIHLYKEYAHAKNLSEVLDIYPSKPKMHTISVNKEKISKVIGVEIPLKQSITILKNLNFVVEEKPNNLVVTPPTWRLDDVQLEEDVIEEIARIYGYHNLPTDLPPFTWIPPYHPTNNLFYWEEKVKHIMKDWGFTEVYTYSMVSSNLLTERVEKTVTLKNPLDEEHVYMRTNLAKSFVTVFEENKNRNDMKLFELANVYHKQSKGLPKEVLTLAYVVQKGTYAQAKGILEQLAKECNISNLHFEDYLEEGVGAYVTIGHEQLGEILIHQGYVTTEINFDLMRQHANAKKVYKPIAKYPAITEDYTFIIDKTIPTIKISQEITTISDLIENVEFSSIYENARSFKVYYRSSERNLTNQEIEPIRKKLIEHIEKKFDAKIK